MQALGHSPGAAKDYITGPMHEYSEDGTFKGSLRKIGDPNGYFGFLTTRTPKNSRA